MDIKVFFHMPNESGAAQSKTNGNTGQAMQTADIEKWLSMFEGMKFTGTQRAKRFQQAAAPDRRNKINFF
jgi:hypothetical protein